MSHLKRNDEALHSFMNQNGSNGPLLVVQVAKVGDCLIEGVRILQVQLVAAVGQLDHAHVRHLRRQRVRLANTRHREAREE